MAADPKSSAIYAEFVQKYFSQQPEDVSLIVVLGIDILG
jgi:hypothetical protein